VTVINPPASPEIIKLPLVPLRDMVIFPGVPVPLWIGRPRSVLAIEAARESDSMVCVISQRAPDVDNPRPQDLFPIGLAAAVQHLLRLPDGNLKIVLEGRSRVRLHDLQNDSPYLQAVVELLTPHSDTSAEIEALKETVISQFEEYARLSGAIPEDQIDMIRRIPSAGQLFDMAASFITGKVDEKQEILNALPIAERGLLLSKLLTQKIEISALEKRIKSRVKEQVETSQREFYLMEQLKAIQKELGRKVDARAEVEDLRKQAAAKEMPQDTRDRLERELHKLEMMPPMSPEGTVVRNYIDWLLALPWTERSEESMDISRAEQILDEDHYGLEKVKERILEHLAVRALVKHKKSPILCLTGPPGVGKTSLAKSIARATGRRFTRLSLGGVRDEAEIRGHRRTYIGALPGRILQSMSKVGTRNPVFLLDEVDKMRSDFHGDPAAALLEVLDPEQNDTFSDHYLELPFDLSDVMFITTANVQHQIPAPLLDRMEVLHLPGYTEDEKLEIAKRFLIPKQLEAHGLQTSQLAFSDAALMHIMLGYTREAGVRNLERNIATVCRKIAWRIVKGSNDAPYQIDVDELDVVLGAPRYRKHGAEQGELVGLATGVAWTESGGDLLTIETSAVPGKGKLVLTGQLGKVMQESAAAALSYLRSRARRLGLDPRFSQRNDLHIHVPEGAIPKDGPSAGVTIAASMISALSQRPLPGDLAMTGEITLRGRVLPVGGIKAKLLAARRGGIKTIILPAENLSDLRDIPDNITSKLHLVMVNNMDEVLDVAFPGLRSSQELNLDPDRRRHRSTQSSDEN